MPGFYLKGESAMNVVMEFFLKQFTHLTGDEGRHVVNCLNLGLTKQEHKDTSFDYVLEA